MYKRLISLPEGRSFFLFGQRGTGKSSLLRTTFGERALTFNLLDSRTYLELVASPWRLREQILALSRQPEIVVIDEVQRVPALLNEVHLLIEEHGIHFGLTGSSARKLKRSGVNLLAGRALTYKLFPLTVSELGSDFNLEEVLQWGSLPKTVVEKENDFKEEYLHSYVSTYLEQEIIVEQLVRQIEPFSRFLEVAAAANTNLVNYEKIARDVGVSSVSIKAYFQILADTLVGFFLPAYSRSVRRRQKAAPKFYFYDLGLVRALQRTLSLKPTPGTFEYGLLFESFLVNEIIRRDEYNRSRFTFSHLRVDETSEVDLVIERPGRPTLLVEIKSKDKIDERDVSRLSALSASIPDSKAICLSRDASRRLINGTMCLNWLTGIEEIFSAEI
jgi:predicted AAA+ superfamily ATPase